MKSESIAKVFCMQLSVLMCVVANADEAPVGFLSLERKVVQADVIFVGEVRARMRVASSNAVGKVNDNLAGSIAPASVKTEFVVRTWLKGKVLVKEAEIQERTDRDGQKEEIVTVVEMAGQERRMPGEGIVHVPSLLFVGKKYVICLDAIPGGQLRLNSADGYVLLDVKGEENLLGALKRATEVKRQIHSILSESTNMARLQDADVAKLRTLAMTVDSQMVDVEMGDPRVSPQRWREWWKAKESKLDLKELSIAEMGGRSK
jgi:hypothetical protein